MRIIFVQRKSDNQSGFKAIFLLVICPNNCDVHQVKQVKKYLFVLSLSNFWWVFWNCKWMIHLKIEILDISQQTHCIAILFEVMHWHKSCDSPYISYNISLNFNNCIVWQFETMNKRLFVTSSQWLWQFNRKCIWIIYNQIESLDT